MMQDGGLIVDGSAGRQPIEYLRVLRERLFVIVLTVVVAVGLAIVFSLLQTPLYHSTSQVLRQTAMLDQTLFGTSVFQLQDAQRQLQTGANLIETNAVAQMVKEDLGSRRGIASLLGMITVSTANQTDIINITAVSSDPAEAADIANSFAHQFIKYRQEANRKILAAADEKVMAEIQQMTAAELASDRGKTLTQKHEELGILQSMQTGGFELIQEAAVPTSPFSPTPVRNAGFALAGGLILGILLAFLFDLIDRRIKDEDALEREFGLPVLASVPVVGRRWARRGTRRSNRLIGFADSRSPFTEAFRTLRSNLKFYQLGRSTQALVVTSGFPQEGKTVTAVNLALSLALSDAKVILIEADLRRPMLHLYLDLETGTGVSTVLAGGSTFKESLQFVGAPALVPDPGVNGTDPSKAGGKRKGFLCMPSGPLPPNPAELLSSPQMRELITAAKAHAEYVLIDTPPLLLVSDALNLADCVDGIIIAARLKRTTPEEARHIRTMLQRSGARALGIVANGVPAKRKGYYRGRYKGYYDRSDSARA